MSNQYVAKVLNQRANAVRSYKKIIAAGDTIIPNSSLTKAVAIFA